MRSSTENSVWLYTPAILALSSQMQGCEFRLVYMKFLPNPGYREGFCLKNKTAKDITQGIFLFLLFQFIPVLASSKFIEQGHKKYPTIDTLTIRSSSLSPFPAFLPSAGHIICSIFLKTCSFYSYITLIIFHVVTYCL